MALVFTAANDADSLPTDFWVDAVRFCVADGAAPTATPSPTPTATPTPTVTPSRFYLPWLLRG